MSNLLEHDENLERQLAGEPVAAPATGSLLLHLALAGAIVSYYIAGGFFKSNLWGGATSGGAIRVNLVSSAIPLPSDQPPNQNVLATEKPSPAPAPPTPKAAPKIDEQAIPIQGKHEQPKPQVAPRTPQKNPQPQQNNRAQYGEQAANNLPRSTTPQTSANGPVSVANGDFGTRFGWYVQIIKRKVDQNWNRQEVDHRTPIGAVATIYFKVDRSGIPSNFRIDRSSGSPTLDNSCLRAAQRVDTFGPLPPESNDRWLDVTYDCSNAPR
ncbi:MAG TPA: TonB family protein [Terracidiphilus sp.]|jgi:protein TonB|nr:TonB family protein [Terracidiphilus sp.]